MATSSVRFPALAALAALLRAGREPDPARLRGPPPNLERLRRRRAEVLVIASRFGAGNLRVIGSVARGTAGPISDVDFLVTLDPDRSLLDLGGLQVALAELLGCAVHVVSDRHAASPSASAVSAGREERLLARLQADALPI